MKRFVLAHWCYVQFLDASGRDPDPREYLWGRVIEHPTKPSLVNTTLQIELAYGCIPPAPCQTLKHQPIFVEGEGSQVYLDMLYRPLFLQGEAPQLLSSLAEYFQHVTALANHPLSPSNSEHTHQDQVSDRGPD